MFKKLASKTLVCGSLAVASFVASIPTAEAATARLRFTPPYGDPFPNLEWFGEAEVNDGTCTASGNVLNFFGPCANQFSFTSATVSLANVSNPNVPLHTFNFTGGKVGLVQRTSPDPDDWDTVYSSAFRAQQAPLSLTEAHFNGNPAWFSLIFVGADAQLIWFEKDPGVPVFSGLAPLLETSAQYLRCYVAGGGVNEVSGGFLSGKWSNTCGLSNDPLTGKAQGASLAITVVPEPEAYAMALASLATLAAFGYFSRRRSAKR